MPDIRKLISAATAPLEQEIVSLKSENSKLRDIINGLEQYARRPLIRVTGINENDPPQSEDTVSKVVNVLKKSTTTFRYTRLSVHIESESPQTNILAK